MSRTAGMTGNGKRAGDGALAAGAAATAAQPGGSTNSSGSGRMAGEDRRRQILGVAMSLFSQRGFRGTTTKEIAQAAGVSEAMVFRHFATKDELYSAILDQKACHTGTMEGVCVGLAGVMERGDDYEVLSGIAAGMLQHHEEDFEFVRLLLYSALEGHELFQMFWERNVRQMALFMHSYISERQQAGAFRDIDPLIVARMFSGAVINHSFVNSLFDPQRTLLDIPNERAAREFTEILLHGIAVSRRRNATAAPLRLKSHGAKRKKGVVPTRNKKQQQQQRPSK